MTVEERNALIADKLIGSGYEPDQIQSENTKDGGWLMRVEVRNQNFNFGYVYRDGFSFSKVENGENISFMRHLSEPIYLNEHAALNAGAEMIVYCLKHPEYKGCDSTVI